MQEITENLHLRNTTNFFERFYAICTTILYVVFHIPIYTRKAHRSNHCIPLQKIQNCFFVESLDGNEIKPYNILALIQKYKTI